jgi:nitrate/nitrite transport system substrate-binding protein
LLGRYDYGDGRVEQDPLYMTFFDRDTNFPWKSHGLWWISQFRRWGMVGADVDYTGIVDKVQRPDIFREVAKELSLAAPTADVKAEMFFDGVAFDPADPETYAKSFAVHSLT